MSRKTNFLVYLGRQLSACKKTYKAQLGKSSFKKTEFCEEKKHKNVTPPPRPPFMKSNLFILSTKVCVCCDFRDKKTRRLWFLRQKCILCDFCNMQNARMLWFSGQQLCFGYFRFKLQCFPSLKCPQSSVFFLKRWLSLGWNFERVTEEVLKSYWNMVGKLGHKSRHFREAQKYSFKYFLLWYFHNQNISWR